MRWERTVEWILNRPTRQYSKINEYLFSLFFLPMCMTGVVCSNDMKCHAPGFPICVTVTGYFKTFLQER